MEKERGEGFKYIPEEIALSILPNLPGKSLVRFRCVSKTWSLWISKTKVLRQGKRIMVKSWTRERDGLFQSIDEKLQVKDIDLSLDRLNHRKCSIWGSCDGLLLVGVYNDLFLWNPTIHSCRKVLSLDACVDSGNYFACGLCFDSHNNDYKVVFAPQYDGDESLKVGSCRNNSWQAIRLPYEISLYHTGVVLNNCLHLCAFGVDYEDDYSNNFAPKNKIIYFDPKMNSLLEVPMPDPMEKNGDWIQGFGVLDGCLCMARKEKADEETTEVLVMKEYGVKKSWQTLFKIGAWQTSFKIGGVRRSAYVIPLFYTEKKDVVLMRIEGFVVALNLNMEETVVYLEGKGYVYEETLVEPTEYLTDQEIGCSNARTIEQRVIVSVDRPFLFQSINQIGEVQDIKLKVTDESTREPDAFPYIYGSCNGLLLIRVGVDLFLWNPVFLCKDARLSYDRLRWYPPKKVISGLCFNSDKNDYKAVLVLTNQDWRDRSVVVGSFRTQHWFVVNFEHCFRNLKPGPILNCHLHFWSSNTDSIDQIFYFDPKTDKFVKIPLPDLPSWYRRSCIRGLGVLDGCLVLVHNDSFHSNKVYLMKQYGVKESWTCMFQFNYKNCNRVTPLFFCDEEKCEVLIHTTRSDGSAAIVSCDIGNRVCTKIVGLSCKGPCDGPFVYEETFARPISLKKAGSTINIQNREHISYRPKIVWNVNKLQLSLGDCQFEL